MPVADKIQETNGSKLYNMLHDGVAPGVIGKPVYAKYFDEVKMTGAHTIAQIFGGRERSDTAPVTRGLNFASRAEVGMLPTETRLRLFALKKMISDVEIEACVMFKTANPSVGQMMDTWSFKNRLQATLKAFDVSDYAAFIADVHARFYFDEFEIPTLVGDLFDLMPMESATVSINGFTGRLMGRLETDSATFTAQYNTAADYTVNAKNCVVHTDITEDLNADSAPSVIEKLRKEVVMGIARSEERSYLDGDTTGSHMDTDVSAGTDFRKAFKGIRKLGLANTANGSVVDHGGDAPSKLLFANMLNAMGKFASEKGDLAWIVGPSVANALVTGAIPELFTAFAFGGPASNVTGQVPPVFGVKATESEWVREDLNASGVYEAAATKTWLALVKKSRIMRHLRAPLRVWAAPSLASSDKMLMSAKKRLSFSALPQSATELSIIVGINVEAIAAS